MKNKILVLALIAAALTAGLVLVGCGESNCPGDSNCSGYGSEVKKECENRCISVRPYEPNTNQRCGGCSDFPR